jgi:hypothetical protein
MMRKRINFSSDPLQSVWAARTCPGLNRREQAGKIYMAAMQANASDSAQQLQTVADSDISRPAHLHHRQ